MKALLTIAMAAMLFVACNGGKHKPTNDTTIVSPPVNGADTGVIGPHLKQDGTPLQGDTSTKNNGQNTDIDTAKQKP